jgi:O-antigen/teichoic acid export membrane protein
MEKIGQLVLKNTLTNYAYLVIRMGAAIVLTRIIFLGLGTDYYGFWSLLWALFGYSLLLDFGFGQTVQKYTAEASFTGDMNKFSRILSAVLCSYFIMSLIIIIATIISSFYIEHIFKLQNEQSPDYYRTVFIIFGVGVSLVFPSGIFPEVLVGMKKIYLRNYVLIFNKLFELLGIYLLFKFHYSLLSLAIFAAVLNLCTNIVIAYFVFNILPGLRLSFRHFTISNFREIADFSIFSYIVTIANMMIFKTDRIILGIVTGMNGVAIYQLGTRVPEIMQYLTTQFQENLAPIAASLHKAGDTAQMQTIMYNSVRMIAFITGCVFVIFTLLAEPILFIWLHITPETQPMVIKITHIILASVFILVTFRSTASHFLLMTGKHRLVATLAVIEAAISLSLCITLSIKFGVIGIAFGILIPNIIISVFCIFPFAIKFLHQSLLPYFTTIFIQLPLVCIPTIVFLYWINTCWTLQQWNIFKLGAIGAAAGLIYLITGWLFYVSKTEKTLIFKLVPFLRKYVKET